MNYGESPGFVYSRRNVGDVAQFTAVVVAAGGVSTATAALRIDGIAQMAGVGATPEILRIMKSGISFAIAGDEVTDGAELEVGDNGTLVEEDGGVVVGKALGGAAVGEVFSVLLV